MKQNPNRIDRLAICLLLLLATAPATAGTYEVTAADWSRPRSADMVTSLPGVAEAVREWHALEQRDGNDAGVILLRHGTSEESSVWAAELKDWLIALGLPGERVRLEMGGVDNDVIELDVRSRR
ncbi:MAG: hypothetical protein R3217_03650 [Gammaproteobacteria bacterium]|nr:hypothetical protein [Gammaproteobacteria bacterium]